MLINNPRNLAGLRVYSTTSTATLTPEINTYQFFSITAQAAGLTIANHSTSTPGNFEMMMMRIKDNGTARAISLGTNYVAGAGVPLPTTTVISKLLSLLWQWDSVTSKFILLAAGQEA